MPEPRAPLTIPVADGPLSPWLDRTVASLFAGATAAVAVALARVTPDPRGHGTHEQFGWPVCGWPAAYGMPCPTCGCTTAACLLVHGRIAAAFATQPFGAAVAALGLLLGVHAIVCLVRGRSFADLLVRWPFWRLLAYGFALLLLSWGYTCLTWSGA